MLYGTDHGIEFLHGYVKFLAEYGFIARVEQMIADQDMLGMLAGGDGGGDGGAGGWTSGSMEPTKDGTKEATSTWLFDFR